MKWTNRVLQEFWDQGDAERAAGLPVSKGFDRVEAAKPGALAASQAGFMQFIVADVYVNFDKVPGVDLAEPLKYMNEVSAISALVADRVNRTRSISGCVCVCVCVCVCALLMTRNAMCTRI